MHQPLPLVNIGASAAQVEDQLPSAQLEPDPLPPPQYFSTLYPSAYRIKRGTYLLINPTFQRSVEDVKLLFEILLAGMQIEGEQHSMLIPDEELASLRSVEKLEVICEDVLPKSLSDIRRLTAGLARRQQPLSWQDFERTVLTLVYTAQTLARLSSQQQREAWTDAVIQLFRAVQKDLRPS
uniref:Family with sequence similarity 180 member A n=1 Tax=Seriola dumerili TaxID=41447 RepID=A0A3B4V5Q9_SERDU